jgi:hypothetical protein
LLNCSRSGNSELSHVSAGEVIVTEQIISEWPEWKLTFINRRLQPETREPRAGGLVNGYYEFLTNHNLRLPGCLEILTVISLYSPSALILQFQKDNAWGLEVLKLLEQLQKWQGTERIEQKLLGFFVIDLILVPFSSHFSLLSYLAEG